MSAPSRDRSSSRRSVRRVHTIVHASVTGCEWLVYTTPAKSRWVRCRSSDHGRCVIAGCRGLNRSRSSSDRRRPSRRNLGLHQTHWRQPSTQRPTARRAYEPTSSRMSICQSSPPQYASRVHHQCSLDWGWRVRASECEPPPHFSHRVCGQRLELAGSWRFSRAQSAPPILSSRTGTTPRPPRRAPWGRRT